MKNQKQKISVSIIIPIYNEEEAIGKVIDDIKKMINRTNYSYEILVVDDASTDNSVTIAKSKNVNVIEREINRGAGASRKTGIINAKGKLIVMLDGDGTYNVADIPKMLSYFPEYDQVNGARDIEKGTIKILRIPAKWLIRKLACYLTNTNIPDLNTGLKAFKKDIMMKYLWVIPDGFSCVTSMTLAFLINGHSIKYVPSKYHKRIGKSKFHPIKDTMLYIQTVFRMIMYFNPLKILGPISVILFFSAILIFFLGYFLLHVLMDTTIILLIVSSFQILAIGMTAELIVKSKNK